MLNKDQCASLIRTIRDNLTWDMIDEAEKLIDDPVKFEAFFRDHFSGTVAGIVFDKPDPLLIGIDDAWLVLLNEWSFKNTRGKDE